MPCLREEWWKKMSIDFNSEQIQCPNCGGYDLEPDSTATAAQGLLTLALMFIVIGFFMAMQQQYRDWDKFLEGKNTATCRLCKHRFSIQQAPATPISPNEELIRAGRKRLEEERRKKYYD